MQKPEFLLTVPHPGHDYIIPNYKYVINQVCSFTCSLKLLKGDFAAFHFLFNMWTTLSFQLIHSPARQFLV